MIRSARFNIPAQFIQSCCSVKKPDDHRVPKMGSPSDSLTVSLRWDLLEKTNIALHRLNLLGFLPTLKASRLAKKRIVFGPDYPAVADHSESLQHNDFDLLKASHGSANLTESPKM